MLSPNTIAKIEGLAAVAIERIQASRSLYAAPERLVRIVATEIGFAKRALEDTCRSAVAAERLHNRILDLLVDSGLARRDGAWIVTT